MGSPSTWLLHLSVKGVRNVGEQTFTDTVTLDFGGEDRKISVFLATPTQAFVCVIGSVVSNSL